MFSFPKEMQAKSKAKLYVSAIVKGNTYLVTPSGFNPAFNSKDFNQSFFETDYFEQDVVVFGMENLANEDSKVGNQENHEVPPGSSVSELTSTAEFPNQDKKQTEMRSIPSIISSQATSSSYIPTVLMEKTFHSILRNSFKSTKYNNHEIVEAL